MTFLRTLLLAAALSGTGAFMTDPVEAAPAVQATASGLKYQTLVPGKGAKPSATDTVTVHYKGWLPNGKVFDQSYGGAPASFPLNRVIPGWTEGLQLMRVGGKTRFTIPAALGYGAQGSPPVIPPNATLIFDVELLEVKGAK